MDFIAPCGTNKSTFWPASRKKIVCNTGKTFILLMWLLPSLCSGIKRHTRKINFFSLVAQCTIPLPVYNVHFISPFRTENSIFWLPTRKKIVWNTVKTFFLFVWLFTSLCSDFTLQAPKINLFFPSCITYYIESMYFFDRVKYRFIIKLKHRI